MNEPWYIFGPKNAGGRSTQLQPAQVPGQVQAAPVVNNITYNTQSAPAPVTDAGGALGGAGQIGTEGLIGHPMNDPNYGKPQSFQEMLFGRSTSPFHPTGVQNLGA